MGGVQKQCEAFFFCCSAFAGRLNRAGAWEQPSAWAALLTNAYEGLPVDMEHLLERKPGVATKIMDRIS